MAVKRKGVLPPPIWRTGGKVEHYAIEVLAAERELILERIKSARSEKAFTLVQRQQNIKTWSCLAAQLQAAVNFLMAGRSNQRRGIPFLQTTIDTITKVTDFHKANMDKLAAQRPPKPAPPITGPPAVARQAISSCKNFAKCWDHSYFYCFTKCKKRKNKTCDLIKTYTKRKKAAG